MLLKHVHFNQKNVNKIIILVSSFLFSALTKYSGCNSHLVVPNLFSKMYPGTPPVMFQICYHIILYVIICHLIKVDISILTVNVWVSLVKLAFVSQPHRLANGTKSLSITFIQFHLLCSLANQFSY